MEIVKAILNTLLAMLSKDQFKSLCDKLFDAVEDWVAETDNKIDDALVLPLINKAREVLDVPDND